jgi:hypothetical protein
MTYTLVTPALQPPCSCLDLCINRNKRAWTCSNRIPAQCYRFLEILHLWPKGLKMEAMSARIIIFVAKEQGAMVRIISSHALEQAIQKR